MAPIFKDKNEFEEFHSKIQNKSFANLTEFQSEADKVFFKAEDVVQGILMGETYLDAFMPNAKDFEIKSPLVKVAFSQNHCTVKIT